MGMQDGRRSRRLMGIGRDIREWAKEERHKSRRTAAALDDFAAALEQRARLMTLVIVAYSPAVHDDAPSRP